MQEVRAEDVARYILEKLGNTETAKLQKLLYYCQAWSLVWDGSPLFPERLEAWKLGPVCREVYNRHPHHISVSAEQFEPAVGIPGHMRETIDAVLAFYGRIPTWSLVELTHREDPWVDARGGLPEDAYGSTPISHTAMRSYFERIPTGPGKAIPDSLMRGIDLLLSMTESETCQLAQSSECGDDYLRWLETGQRNFSESAD